MRRIIAANCWAAGTLLVSLLPANGQRFEATAVIGARYGGTVELQQEGQPPHVHADLGSSGAFGLAVGFRFDGDDCEDCSVVEFRWMRQNTHLALNGSAPVPLPLITVATPAVTLDHFLGDFTHEWTIEEAKAIKPFVTASAGVARMATPAANTTQFTFGISAGVKYFPHPRWGIRFQAEYLPIAQFSSVRVTCSAGCIVMLRGGLMNQFQVSVGPAFRF